MEVIAEIGSNWKTFDDCVYSIRKAKATGADVVKFQTYTSKDLFGEDKPGIREISPDVCVLSHHAKKLDIEFMCTAFSVDGYKRINPYVNRHKIASSEITAFDILETVNSFKKPVILSTGGASGQVIEYALRYLTACPVTLLFCVVDYPARVVDFRHMNLLRDRFGATCKIGYSDHSTDVLNVPMLAKTNEAVILEKHVNFCGHPDTPDAAHSLSSDEFRLMVKHLNGDTSPEDTFRHNPWQRSATRLADGTPGWFRPTGIDV